MSGRPITIDASRQRYDLGLLRDVPTSHLWHCANESAQHYGSLEWFWEGSMDRFRTFRTGFLLLLLFRCVFCIGFLFFLLFKKNQIHANFLIQATFFVYMRNIVLIYDIFQIPNVHYFEYVLNIFLTHVDKFLEWYEAFFKTMWIFLYIVFWNAWTFILNVTNTFLMIVKLRYFYKFQNTFF